MSRRIRSLIFSFTVFFVVLFVLALPFQTALAQDAAPSTEVVLAGAQSDLEVALAAFIELVYNVTFIPFAAPLVVLSTALIKKWLPNSISAALIALVLQVAIWVAFVVVRHFGYEQQFISGVEALTTILGAIAGLVGSSFAATWLYNKAQYLEVPVLGSSRPEPMSMSQRLSPNHRSASAPLG
jgi:hypothetical protein